MSLLDAHLEQIELCSTTIAELPFPPPRMFTNAILRCPDLTSLIRDTEVHERALFSLAPPEDLSVGPSSGNGDRRKTVYPSSRKSMAPRTAPRKHTAVASVLGGDLADRIRRERARDNHSSRRAGAGQHDDIDVELLLRGAEKLCAVYPVPGALEKIAQLRTRNAKAVTSIEEYEELAVEQIEQLNKLNRPTSFMYDEDHGMTQTLDATLESAEDLPVTEDDMRREEEGIAELERKKKMLEDRVNGMEKDLGGLMR